MSSSLRITQKDITTTLTLSRQFKFLRATPFTAFSCEPKEDEVFIADQDGKLLQHYYGYPGFSEADWGKQFVSNTNMVTVHFVTYGSVTDSGWRLEWGEYTVVLIIAMLINVFDRNGGRATQRVGFGQVRTTLNSIQTILTQPRPSRLQKARPSRRLSRTS